MSIATKSGDQTGLSPLAERQLLPAGRSWRRIAQPLVIVLPVLLAIWMAVVEVVVPPPVVPASAPAPEFSAERAMAYLPTIAGEPHTVGSPAQARVREYVLQQVHALGFESVTQDTTGAVSSRTGVYASNLHNILVRVPGSISTGAVAFMAHYDSQPNTPGASDDGSAVAALLETMRAIRSGPTLQNDLLFVFTDAEEADAVGAEAFFWHHPWAQDIRLVVNFEAAGDTGAAVLLEASPGNRDLVDGFVRAVPHPLLTSFLTALSGVMPFGTDMTVFTDNGVAGLSPMYGWHYRTLYHSVLDNTRSLDPRSVQQQGENALGLARYFGGQDLAQIDRTQDAVAFSLPAGAVVSYPAGWALPLALMAAVLVLAVFVCGLVQHAVTLRGSLAGLVLALAAVLLPLLFGAMVWLGISRLHPEYWRNLMGAPFAADVYLVGFCALVLAAGTSVMLVGRRWVTAHELAVGSLLVWTALALLTAAALPGTSYVFTWPAVAASLLLAGSMLWGAAAGPARIGHTAAIGLATAVSILIVVPVMLWTYLIVGFWMVTMQPDLPFITVSLLFVSLLVALFAPYLNVASGVRKWLLPGFAAVLAVGSVTAGSFLSEFSPTQPLQNGVWYQLDADTGQASWYSFGDRPNDPWTAQFFHGVIEPADLTRIYAATPGNPTPPAGFKGAAPLAELAGPELQIVSDQTVGDVRSLALHLASLRQARGLVVELTGSPVHAASINGVRQTNSEWLTRDQWFLRYYGMTPDGLDLVLGLPATARELLVRVTDQSDGLPELPGVTYAPRSADMAPFQIAQEYMPYPETTSVSRTFAVP